MKIQYASDLHLEFGIHTLYLKDNPLDIVGDILLLAGDIGYLGDEEFIRHPFWDWASENFKEVIVIPGNHELYRHFDINALTTNWEMKIRPNVRYVYNKIIHLDATTDLIASTLWSEIYPKDGLNTERNVSDFYRICDGNKRLTWKRFNEEHERCKSFIKRAIYDSKANNIVVMTLHVPSFALMAAEYSGSPINGAFISELKDMITNSKIKYWIYGHSHRNISKTIGDTSCLSNQFGYIRLSEQLSFNRAAFIEL